MMKQRFALKHIPTVKFYYSDEGGDFLVDENEGFMTFGRKKELPRNFLSS